MPWTCVACRANVEIDVASCPECGQAKAAWTLGAATRVLRAPAGRTFTPLRGAGKRTVAGAADYDAVEWSPTEKAVALPVALAKRIAAAGRLPAPRDVLAVEVAAPARKNPGGKAAELTVTVGVLFEQRRVEERGYEPQGDPPRARLVLVHGEGAHEVRWAGLDVLDVTEGDGAAPAIEVAALGKPPKRLPVEVRLATHELEVVYRRRSASASGPMAGEEYEVAPPTGETRAGTTDDQGLLREVDLAVGAGQDPIARVRLNPAGGGFLIAEDSYFVFDAATLTEEAKADILVNREKIDSCVARGLEFFVFGSADYVGDSAYNLALSRRRADAVRAFFLEHFTAHPPDLRHVVGLGENWGEPASKPTYTQAEYAAMRAVEVYAAPRDYDGPREPTRETLLALRAFFQARKDQGIDGNIGARELASGTSGPPT